jgi:hypothetical protein
MFNYLSLLIAYVTTASDSTGDDPLSNKQVYDLLADTRRRYALHYLKQADTTVQVRDLAEQVAAWENGKEIADLTSQERKRVYISMYQSHLPTLDKQGIVEYDDDRGTVTLSDSLLAQEIYLEIVPETSIPWSQFYVGLSVASLILIGLVATDFSFFEQVPELAVSLLVVVLFTVSALVQTRQQHRSKLGDAGPPPDIRSEPRE